MITGKIDVTKILKDELYKGKKGTYLDVVLFENKNGEDDNGNHGIIKQSLSKASREAGVEAPILGNYKIIDRTLSGNKPKAPTPAPAPAIEEDDSDLPF